MKRIIALLLTLLLAVSVLGCGSTAEPTPTQQPTEPGKDYSQYAGIVADPKGWYDTLMAMPIATPDMTEQELRQLCVDAFRMNNTFVWTPTTEISYSFTLLERTSEVNLPKGIAYAGMFYCNNVAKGNVWKALEYYDVETGAMDIEAMGDNMLEIMSSACARACEWAWARVSNSTGLSTMTSYSQYNSKVTPVGPYKYYVGQHSFGSGSGTMDIIAENGEDIMLQSYAAAKMADGLYSSSSYHVIMIAEDPVVVTNAEGQIDANQSYVLVHEQDAIGSKTENKNYQQENGVTIRPLGTIDNKYTFRDLLDKGYLPFTIPELAGTDPVEESDAWLGSNENDRIENGADITIEQLRSKTLFMTYAMCVVHVQVTDANGTVVTSYTPDITTSPTTFSILSSVIFSEEKLTPYADGNHTISVSVRMANGDLQEVLTTTLKK